jgi:hypothetical protein
VTEQMGKGPRGHAARRTIDAVIPRRRCTCLNSTDRPCLPLEALIDYAGLVVCPARFARAESRSSLRSDSLPHPRECRADAQPPL